MRTIKRFYTKYSLIEQKYVQPHWKNLDTSFYNLILYLLRNIILFDLWLFVYFSQLIYVFINSFKIHLRSISTQYLYISFFLNLFYAFFACLLKSIFTITVTPNLYTRSVSCSRIWLGGIWSAYFWTLIGFTTIGV